MSILYSSPRKSNCSIDATWALVSYHSLKCLLYQYRTQVTRVAILQYCELLFSYAKATQQSYAQPSTSDMTKTLRNRQCWKVTTTLGKSARDFKQSFPSESRSHLAIRHQVLEELVFELYKNF